MTLRQASNACARCGAAAAIAMLASPTGIVPSRCRTAMRASGQRPRASARSRPSSASTISSYAEYSIAVTPCSSGPSRTVPRNTHVPPHAGDATSATSASREIGIRVRYVVCPSLFTPSRVCPVGSLSLRTVFLRAQASAWESSSGDRRQQRYLISVLHARLELGLLQVHGREGALGQGLGAGKVLAHAPHHIPHRGRERQRHCDLGASDELRDRKSVV